MGEAKEQKKSDWRKKREEFINNLRAAKEVQRHLANGGSIKDLPPPPPSDTSDYIQCPHCGRRFSEGAADRHIPKLNIWHRTSYSYEYKKTIQNITVLGKNFVFCHN